MSYPDSTTVGTFHQFHAINVGPISPVYEKITKEQLQILEFAENGNAEGIRKMAHDIRYLTPRNLIKPTIINCTDENGWTPLMLAIRRKHPECVSALYQAGARTDTRCSITVPYNYLIDKDANEYALSPLMYAVINWKDPTSLKCVRELFARRKGSSANNTNSDQTERHYLVNVQSNASGGSIEFSALTFAIMFANREKVVSTQLLKLIKLLLKNGVRIRDADFYIFNLQHTKILSLLLDQVSNDLFRVLTKLINTPYLATVIKLKHTKKYKPIDSTKLRASANLLIDHFNDKKLCEQRRKLANNEDATLVGRRLQYIKDAASWFFYNAIKYQVAEIVEVCIERNVRFLEGHDISMSRKAGVDSKNILQIDGGYKITNPSASLPISWDILRNVVDYRELLGEDIRLTETFIKRIVQRADFLVDANVDVDVLTAFGVPDDICDFDNYNYESKITEVQARNLDFAIKHGFDLPKIESASILIRVNNQKEFNKAFFFMKFSSVIIDLGGKVYDFPDCGIAIHMFNNEVQRDARIQNGRVVDADGKDVSSIQDWTIEYFAYHQVSEETLPFEKGDIVDIQIEKTGVRLSGELKETPDGNGWYSLVGHGKKIRANKEDVSFCDIPAAHVIMNATILMLNISIFDGMEFDGLDFEDDYWNAQTAETLARDYYGENAISKLLVHHWIFSYPEGYIDGVVYKIFQKFVDLGAYISPNFGKTMLANADVYPLSDGADIYDLLRKECPEYTFGKKEQSEFIKFAKAGDDPNSFLRPIVAFDFFYHVLEVENSGKETYFPIFPYYITKICDIVSKGKDYELDAYLAKFLMYVGATNLDSTVAVACVKQLLAAGFDINYNQHPDIRIPLFYVLDNGNDLVLDVFMDSDKLDVNQNVHPNVDQTALESLLLNIRDRDTARIMIHKMLQDDRVECPFRQHPLSARQVDAAPEIVDFLLARKYYDKSRDYRFTKPHEWFFDPNTIPLYEMRQPNTWKKKLQEQGIEPEWCSPEDEYTKKVQSKSVAAFHVVKWRGLALQHIPMKQRKRMLCLFAIDSDGLAFEFIPMELKMSFFIVQQAIVQNWRAFQFLPMKAYYERTKEVNIEDREDVQRFLETVNKTYGKNSADMLFADAAKGDFGEYTKGEIKLVFSQIDKLNEQNNSKALNELTEKTFSIMKAIDSEYKKVDYVYKGLPSRSEHGFVVWVRHLFGNGGPHEGQWPAFKEMFPEAAAYAEGNPDTHEGQKEIEEDKSQERKERERAHIQKLNEAVLAQLDEKVSIVHWDDFEPMMF